MATLHTQAERAPRAQPAVAGAAALAQPYRAELLHFACDPSWDRLGADELGAIIHRQGARRALVG